MNDNEKKLEEYVIEKLKQPLKEYSTNYPISRSFVIDFLEFNKYCPVLADRLIIDHEMIIRFIEKKIRKAKIIKEPFNLRFKNVQNKVPLKHLHGEYIGQLVSVDCVVRVTDIVFEQLVVGAWECISCGFITTLEVGRDVELPYFCKECGDKNPRFKLNEKESLYTECQILKVQEPIEEMDGATNPTHMYVMLKGDLIQQCNPGDKIRLTGIPSIKQNKKKENRFDIYIEAHHIEHLEQDFEDIEFTPDEISKIKELSKNPDIYEKIISSTVPAIHGYNELKEGVMLQLFGGVSTHLDDGTRIRGDTHILLVGDPGIGKSQILKYISKLAPRCIYTSGKGSTGAGLTATAVNDDTTDGWILEAGALVLGDRGTVCIDEFDKMSRNDRSSIHEALEQQTISISKAGIIATLNSRCSVLASANPKLGRFDEYKSIADQINLESTLLSRFDLIFILKDIPDRNKDLQIAMHILDIHQKRAVEYQIQPEFLRKYIAYARKTIHPTLSQEAKEEIANFYTDLRSAVSFDEDEAIPITARQLEAIIRLSTASAKVRLSDTITLSDAKRAIRLQQYCVKQIGIDPTTGKVDIDRVEGRPNKTEKDKFNIIICLMNELSEEYEKKDIQLKILYEELETRHNIKQNEAKDLIGKLKMRAMITNPTYNTIRLI